MLTQIHISNLVTLHELHLDIHTGTTVITGETGAGKSIIIDAIELALGCRVTGNIVRPGQEKADVTLCFDVSKLQAAREWLKSFQLDTETNECIIRRTLTQDGRSRSYINGMPSTLQPLRELGELLINIHGQHEHQTLLKSEKQRDILDRYAGHFDLVDKVQSLAEDWLKINRDIESLRKKTDERASRREFLAFQIHELDELDLHPDEFESLDLEHKQLAHADELLKNINQALNNIHENDGLNILHLLHQTLQSLENVQGVDPKINVWIESIKNAILIINDTEDDLHHYIHSVEIDPERLQKIEHRIGTLFDLARKHKVAPHELYAFHKKIAAEFSDLENSDERLSGFMQQLKTIENEYKTVASKLTTSRNKSAKKLGNDITQIIQTLALPHGKFNIHLESENTEHLSPHGFEKILFQIKTNTDQPLQALSKVVSGGELSRIGLAIHMATASQHAVSSLIFDEVDVGIGGGTAEIVGKLLRNLGETHQILCITHQPQVASQGHHHLSVKKSSRNNATYTDITLLNPEEKIREIARMLGGIEITQKTIEHAKEMCSIL